MYNQFDKRGAIVTPLGLTSCEVLKTSGPLDEAEAIKVRRTLRFGFLELQGKLYVPTVSPTVGPMHYPD